MILRNALTSGFLLRYEKFPGFGFEKERVRLGGAVNGAVAGALGGAAGVGTGGSVEFGFASPLDVPSPGSLLEGLLSRESGMVWFLLWRSCTAGSLWVSSSKTLGSRRSVGVGCGRGAVVVSPRVFCRVARLGGSSSLPIGRF